jgi:hypothetical protein
MSKETKAQRLCRTLAEYLQTMQNYGALFSMKFVTGTRIEIEFEDGETILVSFSKVTKGK